LIPENFVNPRLAAFVAVSALVPALAGCAAVSAQKDEAAPAWLDAPNTVQAPATLGEDPASQARLHIMAGELAAARDDNATAARELLQALTLQPEPALGERATSLAVMSGDAVLARDAAQRWLAVAPTSLDAREVILRSALASGSIADVQAQAEAIVRDHPGGKSDGLRYVALLLTQYSPSPELAETVMTQLVKEYPNEAGAHYAMGLLALRYNHLDIAERAAREAVRLDPVSAENGLLLTGILVQRGSLAEADALLEDLTRREPKQAVQLRLAYAKLLFESAEPLRARTQLHKVLRVDPKNSDARYALATLDASDGDLKGARKQFEALTDDPQHGMDAHFQLGRIAEKEERYTDALAHYQKVTAGNQAVDALVRSAAVLMKTGHSEEAQAMLGSLREQFPPLAPKLIEAQGQLLVEAGRTEEALSFYNQAIAAQPDNLSLVYSRSLVYERAGRIDQAERDLRDILQRQPDDVASLNALGYLLAVHTDRYEEARRLIARAYEQQPNDPAIVDSMGWVEYKLGNTARAEELLRRAYEQTQDPEIAAHYGEVLWTSGRQAEARRVWNKALASDPDQEVLRETMQRLAR
jgi:tetratricopeptide (TPR) repeat protein